MNEATDLAAWLAQHLPVLLAVGWSVHVPPLSREEGHEAITRAAWDGLGLGEEQRRALIRGVRAPDVGVIDFLVAGLPFAQRRHALRGWYRTTTARGVERMRDFMAACHSRALALPDGPRRWETHGRLLHCLQDSYSPAHAVRDGARIVRMKHWGLFDRLRGGPDEHGFPTDARDGAWCDGSLTDEARDAVAASRRYLELALASSDKGLAGFLEAVAPLPDPPRPGASWMRRSR